MIDADKVEKALDLWRGLSESERTLFTFGQRYAAMPGMAARKPKGRPPGSRNKDKRKSVPPWDESPGMARPT